MNLTDLGAELQARAAEIPASAAQLRVAGVRARLRVRRRRQAGAVATLAVACLVAVGFSPIGGNLLTNRAQSPASHPEKPYHRLVFDDVLAGDPMIASAVGKRGQGDVQTTFTPRDTNLTISLFCDIKGVSDEAADNLTAKVTLNGHAGLGGGCGSQAVANGNSGGPGTTPAERRAGMARLGVLPGRPSVLRITLEDRKGRPVRNKEVLLGAALYELSAPRLTSDGVVIPELAESYPHDYRLVSYRTARITETTYSLTLDIPAVRAPGWFVGGNFATSGDSGSLGTVTVWMGSNELAKLIDGGSTAGEVGGGRGPTTVRAEVAPGSRGTLMLAYYRQID